MALVNIQDMLQHAYRHQYAIGAFDLINLQFLEAILEAAERLNAPVILSLAQSHFDNYDFELIMAAVEAAAKRASVALAIHLDHGESLPSAVAAIRYGCNSVMVDASDHTLDKNIAVTQAVVAMAHGCGVAVEGELGYVPGVEGEDAARHPGDIAYTDVSDALRYVQETGVDSLAVSIGTVNGRLRGQAVLDIQRLAEINQALNLPLVIHGGSGLSERQFSDLIGNGVAKINYFTALADAALHRIKNNAASCASYTALFSGSKNAIRDEVERCIKMWGGEGRSKQVLAQCAAWQTVEHLIVYNVKGIDESATDQMIQRGRELLAQIPGVRQVITGEALKSELSYRFCWLIRFCHRNVIETYKHHPIHVDFADQLFRPVAGDRLSIDYLLHNA